MALINKIRQRAGLAVGIVAVAMGLFIVGTDLFSSTSSIFNKNDTTIGEIAGNEINYDEFQQELEYMTNSFMINTQRNPTENDQNTLRQQAWELLIVKNAFQEQYDELGITVTQEEHLDMIDGNNIDFNIKQSFTNPQTGQFDRNQLTAYLRQMAELPDNNQYKVQWRLFEESLDPGRVRLKFDNLLVKSIYATEAEAENFYNEESTVAEVKYLYVQNYTVDTANISYSDADLKAYYNEHKSEYEVEESRGLSYVSIPVVPSSYDTLFFKEEMDRLIPEFKSSTNDSLFAKNRSDLRTFYQTYSIETLPRNLQSNYSNLTEGDVRGAYFVNGYLTLYKVSEISTDTIESAKARHILIKWTDNSDESKAEAKAKADQLIRQLRNGADFAELARDNSEDPGSAVKGGDLGWFGKNKMVKPFEEAVFGASKEGLIPRAIESQFGYHIIDVTETPKNASFKVATIAREITPGDETINEAYLKAELLASKSTNYDSFIASAQEDTLVVKTANDLGKNDRRIDVLGNARSIIQWAFSDASVGDVSTVFELDDQYVVAVLTSEVEEGEAGFEDVKDEITTKVVAQKQAEYISGKLEGLSGSIDEIASAYGEDANVYSSSDLKLSSNNLPNVGFVPEVVGTVFGMKEGDISQPIETENGVVIVELQALTEAPVIADYSSYKTQQEQRASSRVSFGISEAIKENADIKDYRYKFF